MKENRLTIRIKKPRNQVFLFTITPPNSTVWIKDVTKEEISEWPIRVGSVYTLTNKKGERIKVTVSDLKENEMIEWTANDQNYHCRYIFKSLDRDTTEFEYYEWVDDAELQEPFTQQTLEKLKNILEHVS